MIQPVTLNEGVLSQGVSSQRGFVLGGFVLGVFCPTSVIATFSTLPSFAKYQR